MKKKILIFGVVLLFVFASFINNTVGYCANRREVKSSSIFYYINCFADTPTIDFTSSDGTLDVARIEDNILSYMLFYYPIGKINDTGDYSFDYENRLLWGDRKLEMNYVYDDYSVNMTEEIWNEIGVWDEWVNYNFDQDFKNKIVNSTYINNKQKKYLIKEVNADEKCFGYTKKDLKYESNKKKEHKKAIKKYKKEIKKYRGKVSDKWVFDINVVKDISKGPISGNYFRVKVKAPSNIAILRNAGYDVTIAYYDYASKGTEYYIDNFYNKQTIWFNSLGVVFER